MLVSLLRGIEVLAGVTTLLMLSFSFLTLGTIEPELVFFEVVWSWLLSPLRHFFFVDTVIAFMSVRLIVCCTVEGCSGLL